MTYARANTIAMILFHFCTICEVKKADNMITFKILSGDKLHEVYAMTTSSESAGNTVTSYYCSPSRLAVYSNTRMWANAQRDGRPVEYRWRPLFNAAVWLTPTTRVPCSNAAKTQKPLKFAGVPQTRQQISAVSGPKFTIL